MDLDLLCVCGMEVYGHRLSVCVWEGVYGPRFRVCVDRDIWT